MPTTKSISQMPTKAIAHAGDLFEVAVEDQNSATGYASGKMTAEVIANGMLNTYNYPVAMPNMQTRTIIGAINALLGNFAPAYDSTQTYSKDDIVTYDGVLYKALQDISTAEAWDSTHWTQTTASESGGGGGGGGNANEEIISYADYMALSEEKKNDGTSYYIYDAQNEGKEIQPVIYSLEEREIGVWTDGKPLYQKTFLPGYVTPTHSGSQSINFAIDIHTLNVDTVVYLDGIWQRWAGDGAKLLYRFTYSEPNYAEANLRVDSENNYPNGRINVSIKSEGTDFQLVTIRYTKTTDVAGSGNFVPSGVPAVHYDGNEKVIGTWFGETLYEKTIVINSGITTGHEKSIAHGISNIDEVVYYDVNYMQGNTLRKAFVPVFNASGTSNINTDWILNACGVDRTNIILDIGSSVASTIDAIYTTIQYTKSTS